MKFTIIVATLFIMNPSWGQKNNIAANSWPQISFTKGGITQQKLHQTYSHLSDDAFAKKLAASMESPLMFFRSFVNTYYADFNVRNSESLLIPCLGDPHVENFGFIKFAKKDVRFVFNDLDDSGLCPLPLDALRYFTSLRLYNDDENLVSELIEEYVAIVNGKKDAEELPKEYFPSFKKIEEKLLERYVHKNKISAAAGLPEVSGDLKRRVLATLNAEPLFEKLNFLDVVESSKSSGGSGGLRRYLVLAEKKKEKELLEVKELHKAGTSYGNWSEASVTASARVQELKQSIWEDSPKYYDVIYIENVPFLVRSRVDSSPNLKKMDDMQIHTLLRAQVGIIANHHRKYLQDKEIPSLATWIDKNSTLLKKRYMEAYKALSKQ